MKKLSSLLLGLAILLPASGLQASQLAEPLPSHANSSFAERLPADTLFYLEVPDIPALRMGIQQSALGKIYADPEMQVFLEEGLGLLDQTWVEFRALAVGFGVPEGLTYWEALRNVEIGVAFSPAAGQDNPFEEEPNIHVALRVGLGEGLGLPVFNLLSNFLEPEGFMPVGTELGQSLVLTSPKIFDEEEWFTVEIAQEGDDLLYLFTMGERGAGSLAQTAEFQAAHSSLMNEGAVVFGYLQWQVLFDALLKGLTFEKPEIAGTASYFHEQLLKPVRSMAFASGWTAEGSFTSGRIGLNDDAGPIWDSIPADRELLNLIPADASSFSISATNTKAGGKFLLELLDSIGSIQVEDSSAADLLAMQQIEVHNWLFGDHRADLEAALLGSGDQMLAYTVAQGMAGENILLSPLEDPAAVSGVLMSLMPRLREMLGDMGGPLQLEMKRVRRRVTQEDGSVINAPGPAYYSIDIGQALGLPQEVMSMLGAIQPTFGITDDGWLAASLSKQTVRRFLLKGVVPPETNIGTNPEAADFLARAPKNADTVSWSDPRPAAKMMADLAVGFAPMAIGMASQEMDIPFETEKLPSAELFTRYLRPSEMISYRNGNELHIRSVGSFGVADLFTVLGSTVALAPAGFKVYTMLTEDQFAHAHAEPAPELVEVEPEEF